MSKQMVSVGDMVIKEGHGESNGIDLHAGAGTKSVLTVYTPEELTGAILVEVAPGEAERYSTFVYKGRDVSLSVPNRAYDVPLPACRFMRVVSDTTEAKERVFRVLALLEVD